MNQIHQLNENHLEQFVRILAQAYPSGKWYTPDGHAQMMARMQKVIHEDRSSRLIGLFREGQMLGGMRLYDYRMNLFGEEVAVGGVGMVAVDLLHKKEKVAKDLIAFYLRDYRSKGTAFAALYPFRVDFYKNMGFGIGAKMHEYRVKPASLPNKGSKQSLCYLTSQDRDELVACYQRVMKRTHGMMAKTAFESEQLFANPEHLFVGYRENGELLGYLVYHFQKAHDENNLLNNLVVKELVYENPQVLSSFFAFLHSQNDQIHRIVIRTQDDSFHHLLADPGNGSERMIPHVYHESHASGVGIMYRVLDTKEAFQQLSHRDFGAQTCRLKLTVRDSFLPENDGSLLVQFNNGRATLNDREDWDVEIAMDIAAFSSLLVGAVSFKRLHQYELATISDPSYADVVNRLFAAQEPPVCMTAF
ncbi:GNAT family N-acetyltransferase [Brevibacillus migulae]|uniref:GNAT family N-acetyltransferase n=1 Tax=Brevibacillus migulae TaxID=1644114 RepID=UPI00106E02F6|nr:GNAT family N-acetyltransferase [Brevibacillus migulae]